MKNILILSVGTRNKIVQFFKENFSEEGNVICADMSKYAPALYEGDSFYIIPHMKDESYLNEILKICDKEDVDGILSLVDPELEILANNISKFAYNNIYLLQSPLNAIETSFNKFKFYQTLTNKGFLSQKSYITLEDSLNDIESGNITFPLFAKPNKGSASFNINKVNNIEDLNQLFENHEDLIIQEFIKGIEYGIDVYVDFISKEVISVFIKEKVRMKAGETDKSIAVKDDRLTSLIINFVKEMGYLGQIDIDVFLANNEYYISEVNPRFGGGYPHAYIAGCNFPQYILNNLNNIKNEPEIGEYEEGTVMMKYNEIKFMRKEVYENESSLSILSAYGRN